MLYPIIMLTAKTGDIDKIQGLSLGADDDIVKPFNPLEVAARVKTQLQRYKQYNVNPADPTAEPTEYDEKGLYIRPSSHKCTLNGEVLPLTPFEFNILWYLCKNHGRVVSAEGYTQIVINMWLANVRESRYSAKQDLHLMKYRTATESCLSKSKQII